MPSKIDIDPLLGALFNLPAGLQTTPPNKKGHLLQHDGSSRTPPLGISGRRRLHPPMPLSAGGGGGDETDTSLLHGESISLTDGEYSDALENIISTDNNTCRVSGLTAYHRPNTVPLPARISGSNTNLDGYADVGNASGGRVSPPVPVRTYPNDFISGGGHTNYHPSSNTESTRTPSKQSSPKKKKKRKSAIKSLKKLVGRKNSKSSTSSSSFDENDSFISSSPTTTDPSSSTRDLSTSPYVGDTEQSPNNISQSYTTLNHHDDALSQERLSHLKTKIGRIRSNIHGIEGDLIATRNELARAHQQLHLATLELADMQRMALEADINLSKLAAARVSISTAAATASSAAASSSSAARSMSPLHFFEADMTSMRSSIRSTSSSLHYFTPTSSAEDSDCFTPRSRTSSYDSFVSCGERDCISTPILDETTAEGKMSSNIVTDKDMTPLKSNGKMKHRRRFKFDSRVKVSSNNNALASYNGGGEDSNRSVGTPTTAGSSTAQDDQVEEETATRATITEPKGRRVTFCRLQSFIRAHDLAITDYESNSNSLVPLHETDANVGSVLNALFDRGLEMAMDESDRWNPESSTGKILSNRAKKLANGEEIDGPIGPWANPAYGDDVLVWTTKCMRPGHGSEYPVMKARGLIPTSAKSMVDLLLDSGQVKQYNKMSLGRTDEHSFAKGGVDGICSTTGIQGEAKIVRSKSQPPVLRKPVELRLLLHARRLPSAEGERGEKYLTIGRSVWETDQGTAEAEDNSATRCEMLLSANLIRDISLVDDSDDQQQWCEITTITHGVSPGIPISIGKRIGLAAAAKYVRDIRAVFEKET